MGNILNHNKNLYTIELDNSEYWDFFIWNDKNNGFINSDYNGKLSDGCLISYIDTTEDSNTSKKLISYEKYKWNNSVNNGSTLSNIGLTGVDNGLFVFDKYFITNKEFVNLFFKSKYEIKKDNFKLILNKVNGNNKKYDYSINKLDNGIIELNGGFYQGFWKTDDKQYQVLPDNIGNGMTFEFTLKRSDLENKNLTLNEVHKENKGMFFYLGTRAENKWYKYYDPKEDIEKCLNNIFNENYDNNDNCLNDEYTDIDGEYCSGYFDGDYIENDIDIDLNEDIFTDKGILINKPYANSNIKTDNKFLFFNHTDDGFTTDTWDKDSDMIMEFEKKYDIGNYFTLFNRTEKGYTTETVQNLIDKKSDEYKIFDDLYNNAFCLQITDDGRIGYKYLIRDCENENSYKIENEYSFPDIIEENSWYTVSVVLKPIKEINDCNKNDITNIVYNKFILEIYVNGKLKLISKELPMFNFRTLKDSYDKQEGVPFNISLGGGTQGLSDVVYLDYLKEPEDILPLEKEFCGTFIGYLKSFRIYDCILSFEEIQSNYKFETNLLNNNKYL